MAFRYTGPRPANALLTGGVLLAGIGLGAWGPFADAWRSLVSSTPEPALMIGGAWLIHALVFWPLAAGFHWVDTHDRPAFITRHRIQSGPQRRPPLKKALRNLAWNNLIWAPLMLGLVWGALHLRGWSASPELPALSTLALELAGLGVISPIVFYTTHRFLHRPWWMKRVHRVHHEFRTTSAMATEYAHPVEFCTSNFGTLAVGVILIGPSLATIYLYEVIALLTVVFHHCGYALPWAPWATHHDWHHYRYTEAYGTLGVLDRLLGTDAEFRTFEEGEVR